MTDVESPQQQQQLQDQDEIKKLCFEGAWAWIIEIVFWCLVAALIMYLLRRLVEGPIYRKPNRIDGKVVIVTGCNTGIGKETAMELARRGARLYMACRDAARCEAARLEIIEKTQNTNIFNRTLDLSSLSSVRQFAERFKAEESKLDILVNNAGVMATPRKLTADGFEQQMGINHLGHFLLTNLLVDHLKSAAPSRVVVLSSAAYIFGRINQQDLMSEKNYSKFMGAYAQSKLSNILFTRKLAENLKDSKVTVNCAHPGIVRTELMRYNSCPKTWNVIKTIINVFIRSPKAGAQTPIFLALDPKLECVSGGFYYNMLRFPVLPKAKDAEMADWLWQESEKLVGLKQSITPPMKKKEEEKNSEMETVKVVARDE
ncbi:retinol dehydrogenase 12 [Stomoxys calcitrans]|uniref:retinol dehydrogenase 12 n=1 Tax=Stomoxys calcitrans TaxID=35570 RepID=UPI0027E27F72|nr:retinol dehydrogenase 12 [Stomoxys calcitrans]